MALTNDDLLARFATEHFERHNISAERRETTVRTLTELASVLDGRTLVELAPADLMSWQGIALKRLVPNTLRNRETMVRAFLTWAYTAGLMSFEDVSRLKAVPAPRGVRASMKPKPYKRREVEEFRTLLAQCFPLVPKRGRGSKHLSRYLAGKLKSGFSGTLQKHSRRLQFEAQVALALEQGMRLVEIHNSTLDQLSPENDGVVVRTVKKEPGEVRYREVPWTPHARLCVMEWLEFRALLGPRHDDPWLMLSGRCDPLSPQRYRPLKESLKKINDHSDSTHYTWHRFRHTFGTERLRAGMPLEQVQIMLGHANLQHTLAYAEIVNADVRTQARATDAAFARNLGLEAA